MALFAVVHGSMAGPAAYTRLAKELHHRGHRALLVALPVDRPELTGTDHARMVAEQLDALAEERVADEVVVVVVAHSASGLLLPLVPAFRPIAQLVYLAAGVPRPGMTLDEQLEAEPDMLNPAWVGVARSRIIRPPDGFCSTTATRRPPAGPSPPRRPGIPRACTANVAPWRGSRRSPAPRSSAPATGSFSRPGPGGWPATGCTPR